MYYFKTCLVYFCITDKLLIYCLLSGQHLHHWLISVANCTMMHSVCQATYKQKFYISVGKPAEILCKSPSIHESVMHWKPVQHSSAVLCIGLLHKVPLKYIYSSGWRKMWKFAKLLRCCTFASCNPTLKQVASCCCASKMQSNVLLKLLCENISTLSHLSLS